MIASYGIRVLHNESETITVAGEQYTICGVDDPAANGQRVRRSYGESEDYLEALRRFESLSDDTFNILLAHHPLYGEAYAGWGADLTLSGHLHGGIVRLPHFGGMISPQLRPFPKYDRGMYEIRGKKLIVSAGLGSHTIPLRINNPPQLVVIDFV